ncbi:Serine/arginine-rich SC35-like splicing factor [Senna tora]|uniref:Serine/arginine-rich SC35-like splicing factor n=1 Tax=Senna tora TaxID=362788 RepID=A0A834TPN5_9FABA|nr:Serine/arginine-rich SC35-like splicing factor [Senna tora]
MVLALLEKQDELKKELRASNCKITDLKKVIAQKQDEKIPEKVNSEKSTSTPRGTKPRSKTGSRVKRERYPFTRKIMETKMSKLRTPALLGHYDGKTDPVAHVNSFKAAMTYAGASDEVRCRAFPSILKGDAQFWFLDLASGSISSFKQLTKKFTKYFAISRTIKRTSHCLKNIIQGESEPLKDFLDRNDRTDDRDNNRKDWPNRDHRRDEAPRENHQRNVVGTINVIAGGIANGTEITEPKGGSPKKDKQLACPSNVMTAEIVDMREETSLQCPSLEGDLEEIVLKDNDLAKTTRVGAEIEPGLKRKMLELLKKNVDIFSWSLVDMLGIDRNVICHELPTDGRPSVRQKKRTFEAERQRAIKEEVDRLLNAGFIREVQYPECRKGSGMGVTILTPEGVAIDQALQLNFKTTNNQVEYEALIAGLNLASELGATNLVVSSDSHLVVGQLNGSFEIKEPTIAKKIFSALVLPNDPADIHGGNAILPNLRQGLYGTDRSRNGFGERGHLRKKAE